VYTFHRIPNLPISKLVIMAAPGEVGYFFNYYQKVLGLSKRMIELTHQYFLQTIGHPPSYFKMKEFAKALTVDGLIIHDKEDKEAPYKTALDMVEVWPKAKLITTEGLGHNLKSKELVEEVALFL
jgi:pimeloyl-ACP methyl ester carboxylesterase